MDKLTRRLERKAKKLQARREKKQREFQALRQLPDPPSPVQAWFDGSIAPINPGGTARYGIVIKVNGETVHQASGVIGQGNAMSNNVAEYGAVNAVMEYLIDKQITGDVTIFGDSQIVVRRLRKGSVSRGLCEPYSRRAIELKNQLMCKPSFVWTPRANNEEADALSRAGS